MTRNTIFNCRLHECHNEDVSKSFRTGRLERELQLVQLSATRCSCIAIIWVSLIIFAAITLCVASQRVFIVVSVYFVIDSVRKLLDTPSYAPQKGDNVCPSVYLNFQGHCDQIYLEFDVGNLYIQV